MKLNTAALRDRSRVQATDSVVAMRLADDVNTSCDRVDELERAVTQALRQLATGDGLACGFPHYQAVKTLQAVLEAS